MDFRILGSIEAQVGSKVVRPGATKHGLLLAVLLCSPNQVVLKTDLIRLLWAETDEPSSAENGVEVCVHKLRGLLEPQRKARDAKLLLKEGDGYRLRVVPGELDVFRFEAFLAEGQRALKERKPGAAATSLRAALELWRGQALADIGAPFAIAERTRLEERRLLALETRIEADLMLKRHVELVPELEALVALHPLREHLTAQLMLALYRSARQSDAVSAFERLRHRLDDELGLLPGADLDALFQDILRQAPHLDVRSDDAPTLNAELASPPHMLTSFVGRTDELLQLKEMLIRHRLVTVSGTGGAGKTRLAVQLSANLKDAFPQGVVFVRLANLSDHTLVESVVAAALGIRETKGLSTRKALLDQLRDRELLLILDNFEHVLPAAPLLTELLQAAPELRMLVTSRNLLGLYGEHGFPVPPMPFPSDTRSLHARAALGYDAVRLFVERAQAVNPSFSLTDDNAASIGQICARLDGLPLAIELAAAQSNVLPPETLLDRLVSRLAQLDRGPPDVDPRHRTLRAAIEWSYELLSPTARDLFRRLGVFAGVWSLEACEAVCSRPGDPASPDVLVGLTALVNSSLVYMDRAFRGNARFGMLATIREFAEDRLATTDDEAELCRRHADFFLALAETGDTLLEGPARTEWLGRMQRDHDNFRAVLNAPAGALASGVHLRMATVLRRFWLADGHLSEGYAALQRSLRETSSRDTALILKAFNSAGVLASELGRFGEAHTYFQSSLSISRTSRDDRNVAIALNSLGHLAWMQGNYSDAEARYQQSLEMRQALGDKKASALLLNNLGTLDSDRGELDRARSRHEASLAVRREVQDTAGIAQSLYNLGEVALRSDDLVQAQVRLHECLDGLRLGGAKSLLAQVIGGFARLAEARGDYERACRWFGALSELRRSIHIPPVPLTHRATYERSMGSVRNALGDEHFADLWDNGSGAPLQSIIEEILEWSGQHGVSVRAGEYYFRSPRAPRSKSRRPPEFSAIS